MPNQPTSAIPAARLWLHRFAVLTAAATFCVVWIGGLVTSHGAGMAVPDWPTTYGYNMFFFPFSKWVGGIFYEHSHRLVASLVGFLTIILAVWLQRVEDRRWLRRSGWIALLAVCVQGLLGGLRVTEMKDVLGVFHATLAQLFLALLCTIALLTSPWWLRAERVKNAVYDVRSLRYSYALVIGLILLQLILGATMRHQHAGLAIPDFPMAYGKVWPPMDEQSIVAYNQARGEVTAAHPITAVGVGLQMAHRIVAVLILLSVALVAAAAQRRLGWGSVLTQWSIVWVGLILLQATLGALTIWTNKAADLATAHVAGGALTLVTGVILFWLSARPVCGFISEKSEQRCAGSSVLSNANA